MKQILRFGIYILLITGVTTPAFSQEAQTPPAPFCENNEGFDDWDFWVDEWNVYTNDEARQFTGTNSITKHYNNCLIQENWVSANLRPLIPIFSSLNCPTSDAVLIVLVRS